MVGSLAVPSLRWGELPEGPVVVLLDQTRLPAEEVELVCTDVPALVRAHAEGVPAGHYAR